MNKFFNKPKKWVSGALILFLCFGTNLLKAQNEKISISVNNASLKALFNEIESKSDYIFTYRDAILENKGNITVSKSGKSIKEILDEVLAPKKLSYTVSGKSIQIQEIQQSQEKAQFTGTILDEDGPLVGASVMEKGTSNIVITDVNGKYTINISKNAELDVLYTGYVTKTISTRNKSTADVVLALDLEELDEVVVVGYGVQKKVNLTGSVSTIKGDDIEKKPIVSLKDGLAGMAPGLTVTKSSGQPGASNPTLRVRGVGTWRSPAPLVIVDGMAMSIGDIIPTDVESISVLKDAASAAIYGSRAANGVILVTTKQGKAGKIKVSYSGSAGVQKATRKPKMATGWQYGELYNQGRRNDGQANPDGTTSAFPQDMLDRMKAGTGDPDKNEANTDWFDELLRTAAQYTQDVTISGGNDKFTYAGTLGWAQQEGVIDSKYERYNTRLNTSAKVTDWLKLTSNIAYINDVTSTSAVGPGSAFYYVPRAFPNMPVRYSDGTWSFHSTPKNPVRMTTSDYGYNSVETNKLSMLVSPELSFLKKSLIVKGVLGYENRVGYTDKFSKKVVYEAFEPAGQAENIFVPRNEKQDTWNRNRNLTLSVTANYTKELGDHYISLLAGASRESYKANSTMGSRMDFPNDDYEVIDGGDPTTAAASGGKTYHALASFFGRVNYSYKEKYLLEANARYDGSSKFAKGNRWGLFPSVSAGWRISEEPFFASARSVIQNLKLKGSWGMLGNQGVPDYYTMSSYATGNGYIFDGGLYSSAWESVMGNQNLKWETSKNINLGLEVTTLQNRLTLEFDYFRKTTDDILWNLDVTGLLGVNPPYVNVGSVRNVGWELMISWRDQIGKDFNYNVSLMLDDVSNKVTDIMGRNESSDKLQPLMENQPIGMLYGWETLGIAHNQELYEKHKDAMKSYNPNFGIGDVIIKDQQREGEEGYGLIDANDKKRIGNTIPRLSYTINLGFSYKNFDFSAMIQGVGKIDGFLGRDVIEPLGPMTALKEHYDNSFDPMNPQSGKWFPRMTFQSRHNYANMSHWVQDASYLRLRNIQLGYTFKFPNSKILERIRFTATGSNVFTITKYKILDPETGINSISFPNVAVYAFGVNVVF